MKTAPEMESKARDVANFAATGWVPYDATIAAGPQHLLASVNSSVAVFDRTGTQQKLVTLTSWFGNLAALSGPTLFDPKALYDPLMDRFVLVAAAFKIPPGGPNQSWLLVSVSQTNDPMGMWWNYALDATLDGQMPTANWADYPCAALDPDVLCPTANMFPFNNGPFQYSKIRVIPKNSLYAGAAPSFFDLTRMTNPDGSLAFTIQPASSTGAGGSVCLVDTIFPTSSQPAPDQVTMWTMPNALTAPVLSRGSVTVAPYGIPPAATQPGPIPLDTGDVRILNAVVGDGSIWLPATRFTTGVVPPTSPPCSGEKST